MDIQTISSSLHDVTKMLNLQTDLPQRKRLNRPNRAKTKQLRADLIKKCEKAWPIDRLPIEAEDVKFEYSIDLCSDGVASELVGKVSFPQGKLIALLGPGGHGKSTLLKLLGGSILPTSPGQIYVPSNLRVLHVPTIMLFFKGTLFENLRLGLNETLASSAEGSMERIVSICMMLGVPNHNIDRIKLGLDGETHVWTEVLSHAEKIQLGMARALIMNPELICVHKPLMSLNANRGNKVLLAFREFIDNKGCKVDSSTRHLRRSRTCILTADKAQSAVNADVVYKVGNGTVVELASDRVAQEFRSQVDA
jgi:ABC-type lipoprotein export system ATPase subunit